MITPLFSTPKKIFFISFTVFLVALFVFVLDAPSARAYIGNWVMNGLVVIFYTILRWLSQLIALAAFLLEAVFNLEDATGFTHVPVVTTGWEITRGLANMVFAIILLAMSFDTILQTNKFPAKDILPKLVIVALTINFSLMFLGILIDFSQVLTRWFIEAAAGGPNGSISDQIGNSLNIARIFQTPTSGLENPDEIQAALSGTTPSLLTIFGNLAFGIVIILVAAFAIGAGAIFMLVRLVSIWTLLIMAPLAWLSMIAPNLPGLSTLTAGWWKKFMQWTFFAPVYAFFIYLAILSAGSPIFNNLQTPAQKNVTASIFTTNFLSADKGIAMMLQYIVVIVFLLMGIKTAREFGIFGADKVIGWGNAARKKLQGYASSAAKAPFVPLGRGAEWAYDSIKTGAMKLATTDIGRGNLPFMGKAIGRMRAKGVQMEMAPAEKERHKKYAALLNSMSDQDLSREVSSALGIRKLLAARAAKERGLLEKDPTKPFDEKAFAAKNTKLAMETEEFKKEEYRAQDNLPEDQQTSAYRNLKTNAAQYAALMDEAKNEHEKGNSAKLAESQKLAREAYSTFNAYGPKDDKGKTKEARDLEDVRWDMWLQDEKEKGNVPGIIRRSKENGNLDKLKSVVANNPAAVAAMRQELSPPEFIETFRKVGKQTKKAIEESMLKAFSDLSAKLDPKALADEISKRELFASVTDKIGTSFDIKNPTTDLDPRNPDNMTRIKLLAGYVSKMTASKVAEIRHEKKGSDLTMVGQFAPRDLVNNFGRERGANAEQKNFFQKGVLANDVGVRSGIVDAAAAAAAKEQLNSGGWARITKANEEEGNEETPPTA